MSSVEDRRRSAGQAGAGAALFGAGAGGAHLLDRRLKATGNVGPYRATYRSVTGKPGGLSTPHIPHIAGKLVTRGAQAVGLPLAAYGVYNAVRAKPTKTRKLRVKEDIVAPVVHHAVLADQVAAGQEQLKNLSKALTVSEQRKLSAHRRLGRATALAGGTLGLAALGARAPGGAKLLGRAGVRSGKLVRVAAHEENATKLSNTLGVGAIGTGAAGSFNYAAQQKLERKREPVVKDNRQASGSAIAGAGGVVGAIGLAGGGIPGVKAKRQLADVKAASGRRRKALELSRAYRGGEFGYRTNAHHTYKTFGLEGRPAEADTRAGHFKAGHTAGLISSEDKVIPALKRIRRGSHAALAGGVAALAYGVHRARTPAPVAKANQRGDAANAALVGAGLSTAAAATGGAHVLEHVGRRYARRAEAEHAAAERIVPQAGSFVHAPHHPKYAPNPSVPNVRSAKSDALVRNQALKGRSKAHARAVGELRGSAYNHGYFANTYGGGALVARKVRGPALTAAAIGGAGLAAAHRHEIKNRLQQVGKAALPAKPARLPTPPPTKAEAKAKEGDREFYRHHKTNRFTTKWMGAEEFGEEAGTAEQEMKNLSGAEGKPAEHAHWRRQLRAASEYHRTRDENDLADEIDEHLASSTQRHRAKCAESGVKLDIRKDAFLRGYRERISPEAERGYRNLKEGRNQRVAQAVGGGAMAGLSGWLTHHELTHKPVAKPAAAIAAAGALASAVGAAGQARSARGYSAKMGAIKAKARSRRAQGLYGPGRGLEPVDMTSARAKAHNLAKAMSGGAW